MTSGSSPNLRPFGIFDKPEALPSIVDGGRSGPTPRRAPKMLSFQSSRRTSLIAINELMTIEWLTPVLGRAVAAFR